MGLEGQMSKKGTPTMGGIIIIIAIVVPVLLCARLTNIYLLLMLITTLWLGALGFADDYIKVIKKNKEGMHGKFKIVGQVGLGLIVGLVLFLSPDVVIRENMEVRHGDVIEDVRFHNTETKSTKTTIPFVKNKDGKIFQPCYSDLGEFKKFNSKNKNAKFRLLAVPYDELPKYLIKDSLGFVFNPAGFNLILTKEQLELMKKNYA